MSSDPKKPFDSAPSDTPDLLQQDLSLDRRRRVPTFQELQAVAERPTQPMPVPTQKVPPNLVPRQAAQAAQQPAPVRTAPPTQAERWVAQQRPQLATPTQPVNPITAQPRVAPPSPTEYAQQQHRAPMPQVTPLVPSQGGVMPEGQRTPARPQPVHQVAPPQQQRPTAASRPITAPAATVSERVHTPARSHDEELAAQRQEMFSTQATSDVLERPTMPQGAPRRAAVLPPEMLVTQPGTPGPFAQKAARPAPAPKPVESAARVTENDVVRAEPAALWRRMGAWLFDLAFVIALVGGFLFVAISVIAPKNLTLTQQVTLLALPGAALAGVLAFVYTTLFAFLWNGRTPGRRALGIHLVDTTGNAPGPVRALLRAGLSLVSFSLFLSGFWLALFDRHGQTLHDKLTRTFVVRLQDA
ncbi:MAG: RDD family protein [Archangium sp.]